MRCEGDGTAGCRAGAAWGEWKPPGQLGGKGPGYMNACTAGMGLGVELPLHCHVAPSVHFCVDIVLADSPTRCKRAAWLEPHTGCIASASRESFTGMLRRQAPCL